MNRSENDIILARRGICQRQVAAYLGTDRLRGHVIPAALLLSLDCTGDTTSAQPTRLLLPVLADRRRPLPMVLDPCRRTDRLWRPLASSYSGWMRLTLGSRSGRWCPSCFIAGPCASQNASIRWRRLWCIRRRLDEYPDQQRSAGEQDTRGSICETELGLIVELLTVTLGVGGLDTMRSVGRTG
jgi:hypothetical protein